MNQRPRGAKEFLRLVQTHAAHVDVAPQRILHLLRVGAICAMLNDVHHEDGGALFIVKGGTAMQLRLGIRARATTDLDLAFRGHAGRWLDQFDAATANATWNGFTVTRKGPPQQIQIPGLGYKPWRIPVQVRYEGREFGSTTIEVAIDEASAGHHQFIEPTGIELAVFAMDGPGLIPCLDTPQQIAQKLHACTEPLSGGNDRVRDIIDIWLLEALLEPADYSTIRAAAVRTFSTRAAHQWPPEVTPSPSWVRDYPALAASHPDAPPTLAEAIEYLKTFITTVDRSIDPSS